MAASDLTPDTAATGPRKYRWQDLFDWYKDPSLADKSRFWRPQHHRGETGPAAAWSLSRDVTAAIRRINLDHPSPRTDSIVASTRGATPVLVCHDVATEIARASLPLLNSDICIPQEWVDRPLVIHLEDGTASLVLQHQFIDARLLGFVVWPGPDRPYCMAIYGRQYVREDEAHVIRSGDIGFGMMVSMEPGWLNVETILTDDVPESDLEARTGRALQCHMYWLYACLAWMHDRIPSIEDGPIERHARRRIEREGGTASDLVGGWRVVTLRTTERGRHDRILEQARSYSHRWLVKAHWRHIGGEGSNRRTWIRMHMKGPDGAPMLAPRKEIWQVVR